MLDAITKPLPVDAGSVQCILALDLGCEISWAVRARDGGVICGTDSYRSKQVQTSGIRFLRFRNWLHELCAEGVQAIVYRESTAAQFRVWVPHLTEFVNRAGLPMRGISSGAIKKAATGSGSAPMEAVISAITASGYSPATEGAAAAIAALLLAETQGNL